MVDVKSYVRDFYAYKRSQYPELILKKMDPLKGLEQLQRQVSENGKNTNTEKNMYVCCSQISFKYFNLLNFPHFSIFCNVLKCG